MQVYLFSQLRAKALLSTMKTSELSPSSGGNLEFEERFLEYLTTKKKTRGKRVCVPLNTGEKQSSLIGMGISKREKKKANCCFVKI